MPWLMDSVDSELGRGKESRLPFQRVSTQVARIVIDHHSRGLGKAAEENVKRGARTLVLPHDGEAPTDAMRTEAREQPGRKGSIPGHELVASTSLATCGIDLVRISRAADGVVRHEGVLIIIGKASACELHSVYKGA